MAVQEDTCKQLSRLAAVHMYGLPKCLGQLPLVEDNCTDDERDHSEEDEQRDE